ncbi:hypothetical protein M8C21_009833, partial [Ambrosia artemisiifolia]
MRSNAAVIDLTNASIMANNLEEYRVYVHRSGRTARASADGCSIALISLKESSKFASLCRSFS